MDLDGVMCILICVIVLSLPLYYFFYWLLGVMENLYYVVRDKGSKFAKLQKVRSEKELAKIDVHVLEATEAVMKIRAKAKSPHRGR